jgi:hypothetical protein
LVISAATQVASWYRAAVCQSVSSSVKFKAGSQANATGAAVSIDRTAPNTFVAAPGGWTNQNVTLPLRMEPTSRSAIHAVTSWCAMAPGVVGHLINWRNRRQGLVTTWTSTATRPEQEGVQYHIRCILVLLFGNGYAPKIIIAALISFFPTLVNMVRGLESVEPNAVELMRVLSASPAQVFWKLRVPSSLPFLFAALKIAATSCVIGAIVSEWIGADTGLGYLITVSTFEFRTGLLYAAMVVGSAMALALFGAVILVERLVVRWKPPVSAA